MKLRKDKWENVLIENICEDIFAGGDVPKNSFSKVPTSEYNIPIYSNGIENYGLYGYTNISKITKPCLTISARGTIGNVVVRKEPFLPVVRLIVVIPNEKKADVDYLNYTLSKHNFFSVGTSIPQLTVPMVKPIEIPLPPIEEQKQIAALFQSIETAMEQVDGRKRI
jgi:restriction endonuclease S subunit